MTGSRRSWHIPLATAVLVFVNLGLAAAQDPTGPRPIVRQDANPSTAAPVFVATLTRDGIAVLSDSGLDRPQKTAIFQRMFDDRFAKTDIGRLVLGRHWTDASLEERSMFLATLGGYLAETLIRRFPPDGRFDLIDAVEIAASRSDERRFEVATMLVSTDLQAEIVWTVVSVDGEFRVLDATFAGRSFLIAQRNELAEILRRVDGSMAGLIDALGG
ncbi:MAG: ABC transporter substrate-binding protein [Alphaproteobacteria bacterium]|nr:ABC transporter substrate-binding protein [Alphaproteobacteria bacterium]